MNTALLLTVMLHVGSDVPERQTVITVVGAPGAEEYAEQFTAWSNNWKAAATSTGAKFDSIGIDTVEGVADRELLRDKLLEIQVDSNEPLWLVLIGHGTFDGRVAKFNMRGPDITPGEVSQWLQGVNRPIAIVNCASSSGPFINKLAGSNRVVVTATKSGVEQNFARFGKFISQAIGDSKFDLDKDEQTSLLEAFIAASSHVEDFYKQEGRLATEHALIDDNGDGRGTPADWFRGVRAVKSAKDGTIDGQLANRTCLIRSGQENQLSAEQRSRRDDLVAKVELFRQQKSSMPVDAYYATLEQLAIELSRLYQSSGQQTSTDGTVESITVE